MKEKMWVKIIMKDCPAHVTRHACVELKRMKQKPTVISKPPVTWLGLSGFPHEEINPFVKITFSAWHMTVISKLIEFM